MAMSTVVEIEQPAAATAADQLFSLYQPIVELAGLEIVGYESLLRRHGHLGFPAASFDAARANGTVAELDWQARCAALTGAIEARLPPDRSLFVNVEPETLGDACPRWAAPLWERAGRELSVVLEVTERALTSRPAELLVAVAAARDRGWGIAIDDVGADTRSLALMPFLRPDVIKLDLRLVQSRPSREIASIVNAVRAEAERTGAALLAEGIETEAHLHTALALGATLGQGYLFGRPAELQPATSRTAQPVALLRHAPETPQTPFALISAALPVIRSRKQLLIEISKQLEEEAVGLGDTCIVLSAFQEGKFFTPKTRVRYTRLGREAAFVAALGVGLDREPAPGIVGRDLLPGDRLAGEWTVAVVAPHFAACLSALDCGDSGPDAERSFDYVLTFDRDLTLAAARSMLRRV